MAKPKYIAVNGLRLSLSLKGKSGNTFLVTP